jgi:hypothetical protein
MIARSSASSGPGLLMISGGIRILPTSCRSATNSASRRSRAERPSSSETPSTRSTTSREGKITDYNVFAPGRGWAPTSSVKSTGGFNLLLPIVGSTSARVQLTPIGSGSAWQIDDLYIGPWLSA